MGYAAAIMAVAAAVTAAGSAAQGESARVIANTNADRARDVAVEKNKAAASDAYKQQLIDESEMAANRVYFNTRGVRIDDGTPQLSLLNQAGNRGINVAAIRMRGAQEAGELMSQAGIFEAQGSAAHTAGYINAGASLLGGAAREVGPYTKFKLGSK